MGSRALLLALAVRSLSLLLPHTYFQPDEFYQAFEPAYSLVFGSGYLTWEWRDLPSTGAGGAWDEVVVGGRLRGWLWPGVFAAVYKLLQAAGLEATDCLVVAPRVVGVVIAALTDYSTYLLAAKVLGPGSSTGALFLSLTSLFNAHLLPRALSTSPETLLTTAALCFYPLLKPEVPRSVTVAHEQSPSPCEKDGTISAKDATVDPKVQTPRLPPNGAGTVHYNGADDIDYVVLDRFEKVGVSKCMFIAASLASLSICIRPTMLVFWGYLHLETTVCLWKRAGFVRAARLTFWTLLGGLGMMAASTTVDYQLNGRLTLPIVTFFYQNVVLNIASFYGATGLLYHLTQSLPILLVPLWYWWGRGFVAALLPASMLPTGLAALDTPAPLRSLARAITFTLAALSLSPHSEWRFAHPLLPQLLLFVLPPLHRAYVAGFGANSSISGVLRQYCRLPKGAFYLALLAPVLPYLYLNVFHGAAQVGAINALRHGDYGAVSGLVVLMPCHSTPWASHLGNVPGWFLTCEPPLAGVSPADHWTQERSFYRAPVAYVQDTFPAPPQHGTPEGKTKPPSHVLLFGELLGRTDSSGVSVGDALRARGYTERGNLWNGFDVAQDDDRRAGGVRVWARSDQPAE